VCKRLEGSGCGDNSTKGEQRDRGLHEVRDPTSAVWIPGKTEGDAWEIVEQRHERVTECSKVRMRKDAQVRCAWLGNQHVAYEPALAAGGHGDELVVTPCAVNHG